MPNRLIHEKSPYLRQHAHNPVDWYPWGEEAFQRAKREDKPIFLSIGYSSCHWCHVMERECFEDDEVASLLNRYFVSIKVDREERPEIDHIYMSFCQLTNGSGGWPLNVFLSPDKKPFLALTYIPKKTSFNRVGMLDLLPLLHEAWVSKRDELLEASDKIINALSSVSYQGEVEISDLALKKAFLQIKDQYDPQYGGFGTSPKFPMPCHLMFLMRYSYRYSNSIAAQMVTNTLSRMRAGGIFDHVGKGFHRYSTDRRWLVPHFEKMLYDQALISLCYLWAYQDTKNQLFKRTAEETISYVLTNLRGPQGAFYASEDADSEGMEGRYYLWTLEEIKEALSGEEFELAMEVFDLRRDGNYMDEATGKRTGFNIIYLKAPYADLSQRVGLPPRELDARLSAIFERLREVRLKRVGCKRDNKLLTDWNSLMIISLCGAALSLRKDDYLEFALSCYECLKKYHFGHSGELFHCVIEGEAKSKGLLDDYAAFLLSLIALHEATLDRRFLEDALRMADQLIELFHDKRDGCFFMSQAHGGDLILRPKNLTDGVVPSGNSMALVGLITLYNLTGETYLKEYVQKGLGGIGQILSMQPSSASYGLAALDMLLGPLYVIVLNRKAVTKEILYEIRSRYVPNLLIEGEEREAAELGHLCQEHVCGKAISDRSELLRTVEDVREKRPC